MSETKTFVFPNEGGSGNGMLGMLAPLLQKNGLDPNLLLAMNNRGNGGFGGEGGWFMWVIFLFFLFPLMGRGGLWGGNGENGGLGAIPNLINNDNGRELLMSAIQGNGQAINTLATNLNCSVGQRCHVSSSASWQSSRTKLHADHQRHPARELPDRPADRFLLLRHEKPGNYTRVRGSVTYNSTDTRDCTKRNKQRERDRCQN